MAGQGQDGAGWGGAVDHERSRERVAGGKGGGGEDKLNSLLFLLLRVLIIY